MHIELRSLLLLFMKFIDNNVLLAIIEDNVDNSNNKHAADTFFIEIHFSLEIEVIGFNNSLLMIVAAFQSYEQLQIVRLVR